MINDQSLPRISDDYRGSTYPHVLKRKTEKLHAVRNLFLPKLMSDELEVLEKVSAA